MIPRERALIARTESPRGDPIAASVIAAWVVFEMRESFHRATGLDLFTAMGEARRQIESARPGEDR